MWFNGCSSKSWGCSGKEFCLLDIFIFLFFGVSFLFVSLIMSSTDGEGFRSVQIGVRKITHL